MQQALKTIVKRSDLAVRTVRAAYPLLNWLESRPLYYRRKAPPLAQLEFDGVLFSDRGNELEAHIARTRRLARPNGADLLVLGVGRGNELELWKRERPASITAVDYFGFDEWKRHPDVTFVQGDIRKLPLHERSFDLVVSKAVLEHVDGIEHAVSEMARVVRPGGLVFANFGPLYFAYGGAHYLGAYEHLWLTDDQLDAYLSSRGIPSELEEGLFYLRHGMFSRRTFGSYLAAFHARFHVERVILHASRPGLRFRRSRPDEWRSLTRRFAEHDLLTSGMSAWMRPRAT